MASLEKEVAQCVAGHFLSQCDVSDHDSIVSSERVVHPVVLSPGDLTAGN